MAQGKVLRQVKGCKILKAGAPTYKNPELSRSRIFVVGVKVQLVSPAGPVLSMFQTFQVLY